jgi:hypothetical protein
MDITIELLGAFLTGIVGPILYLIIGRYLSKQKNKKEDKLREAIIEGNLIDDELLNMREEYAADRIWISQFHNGGNFYPTGKSIQKFSIFYEVTKLGVSDVSHVFSNIPCSLYPKTFQHMLNGDTPGLFIPDFTDNTIPTFGLRGAADSVGTKSTYVLPLFSLDGKLIGTVGLDYVTRKKRLTKDEWERFQIQASKLAGYISSYLEK